MTDSTNPVETSMDMQIRSLPTRPRKSTRCYLTNSCVGKSVHLLWGQTAYSLVLKGHAVWKKICKIWDQNILKPAVNTHSKPTPLLSMVCLYSIFYCIPIDATLLSWFRQKCSFIAVVPNLRLRPKSVSRLVWRRVARGFYVEIDNYKNIKISL
jgi:hypothetical protein